MTTYFTFAPQSNQAFQFSPVLDGQSYNVEVPWNLFGRRYYVKVSGANGDLILNRALIGSPTAAVLDTMAWAAGLVAVTTAVPHNFRLGSTVTLTIAGCTPDAYNGVIEAVITGPLAFRYPLAADPGAVTVLGSAAQNINLVGGYFASTMIYRQQTRQFEVSP